MEKSNPYSNLGVKINKTFQERRDINSLSLKDFLENKWSIQGKSELQIVFIKELKKLLEIENLEILINEVFNLEEELKDAIIKLDLADDMFNFEEFFKNLSPVLLRSLLDISTQWNSSEQLLNSIKESVRIAIEEEIYQFEN
jgi:hypothetical protein